MFVVTAINARVDSTPFLASFSTRALLAPSLFAFYFFTYTHFVMIYSFSLPFYFFAFSFKDLRALKTFPESTTRSNKHQRTATAQPNADPTSLGPLFSPHRYFVFWLLFSFLVKSKRIKRRFLEEF
jgi:hypothetical protein